MNTVEERRFADGIPELLTFADLARLLGVSPTKAAEIARSRPEMLVEPQG